MAQLKTPAVTNTVSQLDFKSKTIGISRAFHNAQILKQAFGD
jgi:hypothetical protein